MSREKSEANTHASSADRVSETQMRAYVDDDDVARSRNDNDGNPSWSDTEVHQLRMEIAELRADVRSRDDALAVVAHDLRNPLNVIALAANTMLPSVSEGTQKLQLERLLRATQRAERLVQDLLDVSAIETGCFTVYTQPTDIADVILSAVDSQHALAAEASVIMSTDIAPDLPSVDADSDRLLQVLENLVGNALKFTHAGGHIVIGAARLEHKLLCWVKDDGVGMSPRQLPHLFDRFWQAKKSNRNGAGLGLTICKGIIEAHGGKIWADSDEGDGTTMFFTIAADSLLDGVSRPQVANVLLVSRDANDTLALHSMLNTHRYNVTLARSDEDALALARKRQFSVALVDLGSSGVQGIDLARRLKETEHSRDLPVAFVTAFGSEPDEVHRAYFAGGVDYITKPFDREAVRKKVAMLVGLTHRRRTSRPPPPDNT